jgi:hypothetical protein
MFQFPRFPLPALCVQAGVTPHDGCWVSPFGHPRINAWSTAPRGFSQSPTSFIGVRCQGIHRWLFVAWKNKDARTRYAVLKERRRPARGRSPGVSDARMPARTSVPAAPCRIRGIVPSKQKRGQSPTAGATIRRFLTPTTDCAFRSGPSESPTRESPPRCVEAMTP